MAIITIGGRVGAGKTMLASRLAPALGYEELYMGGLFREMAAERAMALEKFYAALKDDPVLEKSIDERQRGLMSTKDDLVVQGRVAWYFAKGSPFTVFNIFLDVSPEIGAERCAKKPEYSRTPNDELVRVNADRERTERERYRLLYGIDNFLDRGHYDYALDTSDLSEDEVLNTVVSKLKDRIEFDV